MVFYVVNGKRDTIMTKLYCVTGYKLHKGDPIIKGHQAREMVVQEAKDYLNAELLKSAINLLSPIVDNIYRINPVKDSAEEYRTTVSSLNSDNLEAHLTVDRRFRSYTLEFDMFLDYWEAYIAHHKRIDHSFDDELIAQYKTLFRILTSEAYDSHVEYQLLDLIRNQTAHVQSPVNRIYVGTNGNEIYSDRDVLLANCKSGENKKRILKAQEKEISLSPIVDVTEKCLCNIHAGLIDYQIDNLVIKEAKTIEYFLKYTISKGMLCQPWLLMEDGNLQTMYHIRDMKAYAYLMERISKKMNV